MEFHRLSSLTVIMPFALRSSRRLNRFALACALALRLVAHLNGGENTDYARVADERAGKIVATLALDTSKGDRVRAVIAGQYVALRELHARRDAVAGTETSAVVAREEVAREIRALHVTFVSRLAAELTPAQVDQVKDKLTYGVLPGTYKHYLELYPQLTEEQRIQILAWLIEAREYAMDGGSSEEKHGWFGKYKGKINNYLSAAGYDAKAAEKAWAQRIKRQD
jgi:hypothetical protein